MLCRELSTSMKKILFTVLQFFLFLVVLAFGSLFWHPFHLRWGIAPGGPHITRYFVPDGLLLAVGIFIAIVLVQAIRKRLCNTTWTVVAFMAAVAVGYAMKLGFVTREIF